ncbi:MAG TPA: hypothetical protein VK835_03745 [Bacteroidia bacterium]|nr:hypothetical protein [Bacteroidia bacterium]
MKIASVLLLLFCMVQIRAQELYPSSEPASTMAAKSIGLRVNNVLFPAYDASKSNNKNAYRLNPELMWGINKNWMVHVNLYASNVHQSNFKFEGSSVYVKYRFFSRDEVNTHFRMAVYGKAAAINNLIQYHEINLLGDNTGVGTGIVATQLLHKVALSFTGGYIRAMDNLQNQLPTAQARDAINYSLSAGYLFLPVNYTGYKQTNLNLYVEFTGKTNPATKENYLDVAPALQLIINSVIRLDFIYEKQLYGNMLRMSNTIFSFRFEYNLFNAYK